MTRALEILDALDRDLLAIGPILSKGFPSTFIGQAKTPESLAYEKMVEAASHLPALQAQIKELLAVVDAAVGYLDALNTHSVGYGSTMLKRAALCQAVERYNKEDGGIK